LPIAGVKSKKREIVGVKQAELKVKGKLCEVANLTVNLQSRIFAVGDAGQAVAASLLGKQELVSGEVLRPYDLTIAHLTPQNAADSADDHAAFIASQLAKRPQVIVIDEGAAMGCESWSAAFSQILRSNEISAFQGGIIICCSSEEHVAQLSCKTRWVATGSLLRSEQVCHGAKYLDDLYAADQDASMLAVLQDVEHLHVEAFNPAPCVPPLPARAQESGWTVTAFTALKTSSESDSDRSGIVDSDTASDSNDSDKVKLLGYLAYLAFPGLGELHIARLAVPKGLRRNGYGTQMIRWACEQASSLGLTSVWLYATPDVEPFYERIGFINMGFKDDFDPEEIDEERYSWMMLDISP
jgi:ribosomal protein S18 acetylase RimI-like enzyme